MAVGDTFFESEGRSVNLDLTATVTNAQVLYADGFLGIANEDGESGDTIAARIDRHERQFEVPSTLTVNKGDTVYIEIADLTGHTPDSTAYSTTAGEGKQALFKATADKTSAHIVTGILLSGM